MVSRGRRKGGGKPVAWVLGKYPLEVALVPVLQELCLPGNALNQYGGGGRKPWATRRVETQGRGLGGRLCEQKGADTV